MSAIDQIPAGKQIPNDVNVIIEIPSNSGPVKYELEKASGLICVDRFMPTAMHYPCNYGFVPQTLSDDGDPVDVLVLTPHAVHPGSLIRCRILGMINMTDEAGEDCKLVAVPTEKVCAQYANIQRLEDIPQTVRDSMVHFFEHYKDLEPNKWVKISGWEGKDAAAREIETSIERFKADKVTA